MREPDWKSPDGDIQLYQGDCLDVLPMLPENSVDTCICDPPYGLKFMGKDWDHGVPGKPFWEAVLRVLKPGAFLLAFGGSRTVHRLTSAIEDAGFEIRDKIDWIYGSGFPKSHDISKAIDRAAGAEREVVGSEPIAYPDSDCWGKPNSNSTPSNFSVGGTGGKKTNMDGKGNRLITAPATPEAETWDGWGTAMKPSHEPICCAMKPLDGTFAQNALRHGVAGLNVDGARIQGVVQKGAGSTGFGSRDDKYKKGTGRIYSSGRWPANVMLSHSPDCVQVGERKVKAITGSKGKGSWFGGDGDSRQSGLGDENGMETVPLWACVPGCPVRILDEQSGVLKSGDLTGQPRVENKIFGSAGSTIGNPRFHKGDTGGASRFFMTFPGEPPFYYCPKASTSERTAGGTIESNHPTVKPVKLMEYLCRLTSTPTGGSVLDPFMGSGTTGVACIKAGRKFIGIELDPGYFDITVRRIEAALNEFPLFAGLEKPK